jgi:hypothetical protein
MDNKSENGFQGPSSDHPMPPPIDPEGVKERTQNKKKKRFREKYNIYIKFVNQA